MNRGRNQLSDELYSPDFAREREYALCDDVRKLARTTSKETADEIIGFVGGYAQHLAGGMQASGFEPAEAEALSWRVAWKELQRVAQTYTGFVEDVATCLEHGLHRAYGSAEDVSQVPPARAFYQIFIGDLLAPAVEPNQAWIREPV